MELLLLSPLVTVEEMVAEEFEDSFGEVVKFLDDTILDLRAQTEESTANLLYFESTFITVPFGGALI